MKDLAWCYVLINRSGSQNAKLSRMDAFIPTRHSLLGRLKDWNDQDSWSLFFETYWKLIYTTAIKAGLSDAEAQDVVQETILSVSKSMPRFQFNSEKGSFKSWLLRLTRWRIADHLRKRQKEHGHIAPNQTSTSTGTSIMNRFADPAADRMEASWNEQWEMNLMEAALRRVKQKVDPTQYQIFDLHVLRQWPIARVAKALKVGPGKIYLTKHRINHLIKKEVVHLQRKPI
jgi:RNA polymerase sigma factor (sigma-70 family)